MPCFGFIGMDQVIRESFLQRNYRKMTISWSFFYNFFVKFHGKKNWEPQHDHVISNLCYKEACLKGLHCIDLYMCLRLFSYKHPDVYGLIQN